MDTLRNMSFQRFVFFFFRPNYARYTSLSPPTFSRFPTISQRGVICTAKEPPKRLLHTHLHRKHPFPLFCDDSFWHRFGRANLFWKSCCKTIYSLVWVEIGVDLQKEWWFHDEKNSMHPKMTFVAFYSQIILHRWGTCIGRDMQLWLCGHESTDWRDVHQSPPNSQHVDEIHTHPSYSAFTFQLLCLEWKVPAKSPSPVWLEIGKKKTQFCMSCSVVLTVSLDTRVCSWGEGM